MSREYQRLRDEEFIPNSPGSCQSNFSSLWPSRIKLKFLVALFVFVAFWLMVGFFTRNRSFRHYKTTGTESIPDSLPRELKILSWNIFMRPPLISNYNGDYKNERLHHFINDYLPNYDIVALQEIFMFCSSRRAYLIAEARKRGFNYHTAAPFSFIDGGLLVLSKYPIMQSAFQSFSRGMHSDRLAVKGVLHARIQLSTHHSIDLFTTHLQASYRHPSSKAELLVRMKQLDALRTFVDLHATGSMTFICGDFNIDAKLKEADFLHLQQLFAFDFRSMNQTPTFGVNENCAGVYCSPEKFQPEIIFTKPHDWGSCQEIDHFLMRGGIEGYESVCEVNQMLACSDEKRFTHLSDHFALQFVMKKIEESSEYDEELANRIE